MSNLIRQLSEQKNRMMNNTLNITRLLIFINTLPLIEHLQNIPTNSLQLI